MNRRNIFNTGLNFGVPIREVIYRESVDDYNPIYMQGIPMTTHPEGHLNFTIANPYHGIVEQLEEMIYNPIDLEELGQEIINGVFNDPDNIDYSNDYPKHPVSEGVMKRLKVVNFCDIVNCKILECPICIEKFNDIDKVMILKCKHYFHKRCIEQWFNEHDTCPVCREHVK